MQNMAPENFFRVPKSSLYGTKIIVASLLFTAGFLLKSCTTFLKIIVGFVANQSRVKIII
jgi:hypothetical protein